METQALATTNGTEVATIWNNPGEIKKLFAPDLTNQEFEFFMGLSKVTGANPFKKEIWAVKYRNKKTGEFYPAQVFHGRDFYRRKAQELPQYMGHINDAVYENDSFTVKNGIPEHSYTFKNRGRLVGAYCLVYVQGRKIPFYVFVNLSEYSKGQEVWADKPATMIKKVAEAQALRGAFQGVFAGTYDESEDWAATEQKDITPPQEGPKKTNGKQLEDRLKNAYQQITELQMELDYHQHHIDASVKKHLGVDVLADCRDLQKLYDYYQYLDSKVLTTDELNGMLETVQDLLPEEVDNFVKAADSKDYATCNKLFEKAQKNQKEVGNDGKN